MKRASSDFHQFHTVDEQAKAKLKYQTLANEFLELQKEFVSKKRKLKAANKKRDTFFAEVRFLRQRQKYLYRIKHSNKGKDLLRLPNSDEEINVAEGERNLVPVKLHLESQTRFWFQIHTRNERRLEGKTKFLRRNGDLPMGRRMA